MVPLELICAMCSPTVPPLCFENLLPACSMQMGTRNLHSVKRISLILMENFNNDNNSLLQSFWSVCSYIPPLSMECRVTDQSRRILWSLSYLGRYNHLRFMTCHFLYEILEIQWQSGRLVRLNLYIMMFLEFWKHCYLEFSCAYN